MSSVLIDTGPLVAYLMRTDLWHRWAVTEFAKINPPFLTCEPVLTEAFFLVRRDPNGVERLLQALRAGYVRPRFSVAAELPSLDFLLRKYASAPMSLADACLVRMSEQIEDATVFTIDKHFKLYRRNGRQMIRLIVPETTR